MTHRTRAPLLALLAALALGGCRSGIAQTSDCAPDLDAWARPMGPVSPLPELEIVGRVNRISVSPAGRVWLTTYLGNSYTADSVGGDWRRGTIRGEQPDSLMDLSSQIDAITFFTPDTAFAWGMIHGSDPEEFDATYVLRTTDGGASWDSVAIGDQGWLHEAFANPRGEGWMSGSEGHLLYTRDFAATWRVMGRPFASQLISLHMGADGVGIAGSISEGLKVTRDGGATWQPLPTPHEQNRYPRPPREDYGDDVMITMPEGFDEEEFDSLSADTIMEPVEGVLPEEDYFDPADTMAVAPWDEEDEDDEAFPAPEEPDEAIDRIDRVGLFNGRAVIVQGGRVFHSALDRVDWQPLPGDSLVHFAVSADGAELAGVTCAGRVVRYDAALRPTPLPGRPLRASPLDVVARDGGVYVLDEQMGVYRIDGAGMRYGFPLTREQPLRQVENVRRHAGRLWGTTMNHVYTSDDDGATWTRRGDVPFYIRGFAVRGRDELLLWDGHGNNTRFDAATGAVARVPTLAGDDVVAVIERHDSLWVAYGGKQHESGEFVAVSRTFFPGEFAGSRDHGFVSVSRDRGATWTRIDRWDEGGVALAFVHPDGGMTLFSWLGKVRRLARDGGGWRGETLWTEGPRHAGTPYAEQPMAAYFADARRGWVAGNIHNGGYRAYRTDDGGRTWTRVRDEFPFVHVQPAGGAHIAATPTSVYRLEGETRTQLYVLSAPRDQWEWPVSQVAVDGDDLLIAAYDRGLLMTKVSGGEPRALPASVRVAPRSMH